MIRFTRMTSIVAAFAAAWIPGFAFAASPAEHGAEHSGGIKLFGDGFLGGPGEDGKTGFVLILINFVVLMLVLNKILFKNLRRSNAEASDVIRLELERATRARSEAEALVKEYETKLTALESEVVAIREAARTAAEAEYERILGEAREQAAKIEQAAIREGEFEAGRRRAELENEIVDMAIARAEAAIRSSFAADDQRRLVDAWVTEVGATNIDERTGAVN